MATIDLLESRCLLSAEVAFTLAAGAALTVGNDVNVSNTNNRDEAEAAFAVNPADPAWMFIASAVGEREGGPGNSDRLFASYSNDGGKVWRISGDNGTIAAPNYAPGQAGCDSSAAFDDYGHLYLAYQSAAGNTNVVQSDSSGSPGSFADVKRLGKGTGWSTDDPKLAIGRKAGGIGQTLWVAYNASQPDPSDPNNNKKSINNQIFVQWADIDAEKGLVGPTPAIWSAPIPVPIPADPAGYKPNYVSISVGTDGRVAVAMEDDNSKLGTSSLYVSVKIDGSGPGGFSTPRLIDAGAIGTEEKIDATDNAIYPRVDIAYDVSKSHPNRLYAVYTTRAGQEVTGGDTEIKFSSSENDGQTWGDPIRVNDDVGKTSQFLPRIALDRDTGFVGVAWYDARDDAANNTSVKVYATVSRDGGESFMSNVAVSRSAYTQLGDLPNQPHRFDYGDYIGLAFVGGSLFPAWAGVANGRYDIFMNQVVVGGGQKENLRVEGTGGEDVFVVKTTGGRFLQIYDSADTDRVPTFTATTSAVEFVGIYGAGGNDLMNASGIALDDDGYGVPIDAVGGAGNDTLLGGAGDDSLYGDQGDSVGVGEIVYDGNDYLEGNGGNDLMYGGEWDDQLMAGLGNDTVYGDYDAVQSSDSQTPEGNDYIDLGAGDDLVYGDSVRSPWPGSCDDVIYGGEGNDTIFGEHGSSVGCDGSDLIDGGTGADLIQGDGGYNTIAGADGDDTISGSPLDDSIDGGEGDDAIDGRGGLDTILAGGGDDTLSTSGGRGVLDGGDGDDHLIGGSQADTLIGGAGNDLLEGGDGGDSLVGGAGNDTLVGASGWDTLEGGDGADSLSGGDGNDTLRGEAGADTLDGGAGDDELDGGADDDALICASGTDESVGIAGNDLATISAGATLVNTGALNFNWDGDAVIAGAGGGYLVNHGTVAKTGGTGVSVLPVAIAFSNPDGTIDVQTGTVRLAGYYYVGDWTSLTKAGAGVLEFAGGFGVSGTMVQEGGEVIYGGTMAVDSGGLYQLTGGELMLNGTVENHGTIRVGVGGEILAGSGDVLENYGTIDLIGDGEFVSGGSLVNYGMIMKSGGDGVSGIGDGVVVSSPSGVFDVEVGTLRLNGNWLHVLVGQTFLKSGEGTLELPGGLWMEGNGEMSGGVMAVGTAGESSLSVGGSFVLSGGRLESVWTSVGGEFVQLGGVHEVSGTFSTVNSADGLAVYRMIDGEFDAHILEIGIGGEGGRMEQSGGLVSVSHLRMGDGGWGQLASTSGYVMSGGELVASVQIAVGFGSGGSAVFEQTGGSVTSLGWFDVGGAMEGTYRLSGGSLSAACARVGLDGGTGLVEQTGGAVEMGGTFVGLGGVGSIIVSGGSYADGGTWVGAAGTGELVVEGTGVYAVTGDMYVGDGWHGLPVLGSVVVEGDGAVSVSGNFYVGTNGGSGSVSGVVAVGGAVVEG